VGAGLKKCARSSDPAFGKRGVIGKIKTVFLKLPAFFRVIPGMNLKKIILAAALTSGLFASAVVSQAAVVVSAAAPEGVEYTAPVPLHVVSPVDIPRHYQNETIRLSLTIDETGRAHHVDLLSGRDPSLVKRLLPVVARWQFKPATLNGRAVSARVVLPLQLVDGPAI